MPSTVRAGMAQISELPKRFQIWNSSSRLRLSAVISDLGHCWVLTPRLAQTGWFPAVVL